MLTNRTFDVSRLEIASAPGTKSGSVQGPGRVRNVSKYSLKSPVRRFTIPSCFMRMPYHLERGFSTIVVISDSLNKLEIEME